MESKEPKQGNKLGLGGLASGLIGGAGKIFGNAAESVGKVVGDLAGNAGTALGDALNNAGKTISGAAGDAGRVISDIAGGAGKLAGDVSAGATSLVGKANASLIDAFDENGDGQIDVEDIIIKGLKMPGIGISRDEFLRRELKQKYPLPVVEDAIARTPALAGISIADIDMIADTVIQQERYGVTGISAALGAVGGVAMVATLPADIMQYYGYMLRTAQKLMYLYGFPELDVNEKGSKFDAETLNVLVLGLGAMYGVQGASKALATMANMLAQGVEKKLLKTALTKGTIYPIVKSVAKWFNMNMTKQVFAGFFKKAIPLVGSAIGGGITYLTFKPCCDRLKVSLQNTVLAKPFDAVEGDSLVEIQTISEVEIE